MDHRRAVRPPQAARRALFQPPTSRRQNPAHNKSAVHIATEEASPDDDLVERDSNGAYKVNAPSTAMKMGVGAVRSTEEEEREQEEQMIALYGKPNVHWDQAGMFLGKEAASMCRTRLTETAILEEVKAALQSSMERKVQSLEADRWMFEGDVKSKG